MATFPPRVFGYRPCICDHATHVRRAKKWRFTAKQAKSSSRLSRTIAAVCLAPTARVMLVDAVWSGVLMGLALPLGPLLVARWVLIGQEQTADHGGAGGDGGGVQAPTSCSPLEW